jgi:hypothetical protein
LPPLHKHFLYGLCNASRAHAEALVARRAGKEIASDYSSDSNPASGYYSDSSYEFDFGSDPIEPKSEINTTEEPLSGPATGLVITSTPAERYVYWPDRKPADLADGNSRRITYLDSLPFQEGTPLAPTEEHTSTEVATTDSGLGTPNRQVFMAAGETVGPSGTLPDQYHDDISEDELSANAPADETTDDKNARRDRNRKPNEHCKRLRETFPIQNLNKALDQVTNQVHTTPEQCLMSITTIARQAQGIHASEVIAKLAEDAHFIRVDNRVTQVPPVRTHEPRHHEATSRSPADGGRNRTREEQPPNPNHSGASAGGPSQGSNSAGGAGGGGGSSGGSSSHGAGRRAGGGGDRGGRGHANNHVTGNSRGSYDARHRIEEIRRKKASEANNSDGFPAFSARLRDLLLLEKFKPLEITKYDVKQDLIQWLRCYALSIENVDGNNDTKCLYFPLCLDHAPLTWLESLDKNSINEWDQLKAQFTNNFAGTMGRSGTRMDLAMVKQNQGETLRQCMWRFFDKRTTVVDVTDKVIDLFQDGLYHHRTFEDFIRRHLSSVTKLKDMIMSWADKEEKAITKYDSIRGKSKHNTGGNNNNNNNNNNNRDQGVATTTTTQVLIASASQTTQSRLSSALRKTTRRRPLAASKTCSKRSARGIWRAPHYQAVLPTLASTQRHPRPTASSRQERQEESRRRQQRLPGTRQDDERPLRRTTHQRSQKATRRKS